MSETSCFSWQLAAAAVDLSKSALSVLDLQQHTATHPRIGVVDHISCNPLGAQAELCSAAEVAQSIGVPHLIHLCHEMISGCCRPVPALGDSLQTKDKTWITCPCCDRSQPGRGQACRPSHALWCCTSCGTDIGQHQKSLELLQRVQQRYGPCNLYLLITCSLRPGRGCIAAR